MNSNQQQQVEDNNHEDEQHEMGDQDNQVDVQQQQQHSVEQQEHDQQQQVENGDVVHMQHQQLQQGGPQQDHENMMDGGNLHQMNGEDGHDPIMAAEEMIGNGMTKQVGRKKRMPRFDRASLQQLLEHRNFNGKILMTILDELDKSSVSGHTQHDFLRYFDSHDFHALRDNCNRTCLRLICRSRGIKSASNIKEILAAKLATNIPVEVYQQHEKAIRGGHSPRKPKRKSGSMEDADGSVGIVTGMGDGVDNDERKLGDVDGYHATGSASGPQGVNGQPGLDEQLGDPGMQVVMDASGRKDKSRGGSGGPRGKRKVPRASAKEELHATLRHLSQVQKNILNRLGNDEVSKSTRLLEAINMKMKTTNDALQYYESRAEKLRATIRDADIDAKSAEIAREKLPRVMEQINELESQYNKLVEQLKETSVASLGMGMVGEDQTDEMAMEQQEHSHEDHHQDGNLQQDQSGEEEQQQHHHHGHEQHGEDDSAQSTIPTQQI